MRIYPAELPNGGPGEHAAVQHGKSFDMQAAIWSGKKGAVSAGLFEHPRSPLA